MRALFFAFDPEVFHKTRVAAKFLHTPPRILHTRGLVSRIFDVELGFFLERKGTATFCIPAQLDAYKAAKKTSARCFRGGRLPVRHCAEGSAQVARRASL